jgi:hypothetical protein
MHVVDHLNDQAPRHRGRAQGRRGRQRDGRRQEGRVRPGRRAVAVRQAPRRRGDAARGDGRPGGRAPEGFVIYLTTHSDEPPAGVFKEARICRDVRDGVIEDPTFLPVLYEWPEKMLEARPTSSRRISTSPTRTSGRSVRGMDRGELKRSSAAKARACRSSWPSI